MLSSPCAWALFRSLKSNRAHDSRKIDREILFPPDFVIPAVVDPHGRPAPGIGRPLAARIEINGEENTAWTQHSVSFGDDLFRRFGRDFVMKDVRRNDIEMVVGKLRVFGQTMSEIDIHV